MGKRRAYEHTQTTPRDDWCSPESLIRLVTRMGPIGLDPMTNPQSLVPAQTHWFLPGAHSELRVHAYPNADVFEVDALEASWDDLGIVYVNPIYGREANVVCAQKIAQEGRAGVELFGLVPAATGAQWFQENYGRANAICFLEGRLCFVGAPCDERTGRPTPADFDSALVYYGRRAEEFRRLFEPEGLTYVRPQRSRKGTVVVSLPGRGKV